MNVRDRAQQVALPEAVRGAAMQEVFTGETAPAALDLPPYGFRVYRGLARG